MDIIAIQKKLNEFIAKKIQPDGIFGDNTKLAVEEFQKMMGLTPDGIVGKNTLSKLFPDTTKPNIMLTPSQRTIDDLIQEETGGRKYYEKYLSELSYPEGDSGITGGVGYDFGYNTIEDVKNDWGDKLKKEDLDKILEIVGIKSERAKLALSKVKGVFIPYDIALEVFYKKTLPAEAEKTKNTFPGVEELNPDTQGVLISLVYNRGTGLKDKPGKNNRLEMRNIVNLVKTKNYEGIALQLESMTRLWIGKGLNGLVLRYRKDANIVRSSAFKNFKDVPVIKL